MSLSELFPMSPVLQHECTRVPVTALASCGTLLVAAEGPFVRFYHAKDSCYISSTRVFKAQAVHGISVCSKDHDDTIRLVVWGGRLSRVLEIGLTPDNNKHVFPRVCMSDTARASDWILNMAPFPNTFSSVFEHETSTCVAVTAHNALLQLTVEHLNENESSCKSLLLSISELTSSFRSILYSAHLIWDSANRILIAAGTAFGEIMYWSWSKNAHSEPVSRIHRVFLGHEGSIFGVQISKELELKHGQNLKRVIASCSDDRTIRIWNISDVVLETTTTDWASQGTHHTGLGNESTDVESAADSGCLAIGWGHTSRVWMLQFVRNQTSDGTICLLSAGEDATTRTWRLIPNDDDTSAWPYKLSQIDCAAYHNGKNIWTATIVPQCTIPLQVVRGAADSKITSHPLICSPQNEEEGMSTHTLQDILSMAQSYEPSSNQQMQGLVHTSTKKADVFRGYCFVDDKSFLLTTNSGKVFLEKLSSGLSAYQQRTLINSDFIDQLGDLSEHSVCSSATSLGIAFIAGSRGSIYFYSKTDPTLRKLYTAHGKVGDMFVADISCTSYSRVALLVTLAGQKEAQLLYVDIVPTQGPEVSHIVTIPTSELMNDSTTTSMSHIDVPEGKYLCLGFRRGSVAVYAIPKSLSETFHTASLFKVIDRLHGGETVTSLVWTASAKNSSLGHLLSVGRDGFLTASSIDFTTQSVELVHNLILPIGSKIEGLYLQKNHIIVHGFSSKRWVLYDVTAEEEIMGVETGGAHRSWAFQPHSTEELGGTLVWTRASSMHICSQTRPAHHVIRSGGHGREIKAVAVSPPRSNDEHQQQFIATGAEDTDIKIFQYIDGDLTCRKTLQRHTTGIHHLQWSEDGDYLFSSGGREEFYIWRFRKLPSFIDIGVVCEFVYPPESEYSDLRIMSFDVTTRSAGYDIVMVFSDSSIKVYHYDPTSVNVWQSLGDSTYFTSCLTQCMFLSSRSILTAGTDGHAVIWPSSFEPNQFSEATSAFTPSWQYPTKIHQNSSKTMIRHTLENGSTLIVSGGDDGSLAFLLAQPYLSMSGKPYACPPTLVCCAHASAVTACTILSHESRIFVVTSGNDEWVRVWEVCPRLAETDLSRGSEDVLSIKRVNRLKTHVADVSSMAVLRTNVTKSEAKVLICGVGMEVIRVEWNERSAETQRTSQ